MYIIIEGNKFFEDKDLLIDSPSLTLVTVSIAVFLIGTFIMTSADIFSASKIGTPLAESLR